ncbi:MAG: protein-ADP-ribose hydrolase [Prevotella sp.]|nr:protein-ADP-ribose hydrolase [Alistipes senegalensis]MCM1357462.1 protein-ADP-ribose hydrolase [Prevotella sp.]MCM1473207.1 protein-ADP-ribose hydrolase [Muribaculaceae bacterium]
MNNFLIKYFLNENPRYSGITIPKSEQEQFRLYRSLVNIRPAMPISRDYINAENLFLQGLTEQKGITDIADLQPVENNIYLWQGDITTLKCGAIVNAANSGMTGCYQPCHNCIDNCIHTFAGVQLRLECGEIMRKQGYEEPTGQAKITSAYNLPCDYVIHTVGAIVNGRLTEKHCELLQSCYQSCLELAIQNNIESIAFCCISTGVFGFPKQEAAEIAVKTVREFLKNHSIKVIFNVFGDDDYEIYKRLLG